MSRTALLGKKKAGVGAGQKRVDGGRCRYVNESRHALFFSGNKPGRRLRKDVKIRRLHGLEKKCMGCELQTKNYQCSPKLSE